MACCKGWLELDEAMAILTANNNARSIHILSHGGPDGGGASSILYEAHIVGNMTVSNGVGTMVIPAELEVISFRFGTVNCSSIEASEHYPATFNSQSGTSILANVQLSGALGTTTVTADLVLWGL